MDNTHIEKPKRKQKPIERAVVHSNNIKKLDGFKKQLLESVGEYITINYTDLVNLFIEAHSDILTETEIELVRVRKYDQVKHLKWILAKAQEAKKNGEHLMLSDVFNASPDSTMKMLSRKPRKQKKSKSIEIDASEAASNVAPENLK